MFSLQKGRKHIVFLFLSFIIIINGRSVVDGLLNDAVIASDDASGFLQGNIEFSYDSSVIPSTIQPDLEVLRIPVDISYFVSGFGVRLLMILLQQKTIPISVAIENLPQYVYASVSPDFVYPVISDVKPDTPEQVVVSVNISKSVLAFQTLNFDVVATADAYKGRFGRLTLIKGVSNRVSVGIKAGFYSNFQYEYRTFAEILPNETATFPITIMSYSNAPAKLMFEIISPPENWTATIPSEYMIGTAAGDGDNTGVVNLVIKGPSQPGYYNVVEQFSVRIMTQAGGHPELGVDNATVLQFTVRCRGEIIDDDSVHISLVLAVVLSVVMLVILGILIVVRRRY